MSSELTDTNLNFTTNANINANNNITITNSTTTTYTWPTVDATINQVLSAGATPGTMEWVNPSAASATPGGIANSIQFNNSGSFDGETTFLWDTTNNRLLVAPNTLVDSTPFAALPTPQYFTLDIRNDANASYSVFFSNIFEDSFQFRFTDDPTTTRADITLDATGLNFNNTSGNINVGVPTPIPNNIQLGGENISLNSDTLDISGISVTLGCNPVTITSGGTFTNTTTNGTNRIGSTNANLIFQTDSLSYTFPTTDPLANQVLRSDASGNMIWSVGVDGSPTGPDGAIQRNLFSSFYGVNYFLYDDFTANSLRLLLALNDSTTAPIYTSASQFTLDFRNDGDSINSSIINIQGGSNSTGNGIRFSNSGTPTNTYITYDYTPAPGVFNINSDGFLNISAILDIAISSSANMDINYNQFSLTSNGTATINSSTNNILETTSNISLEGPFVFLATTNVSGGGHGFSPGVLENFLLYQDSTTVRASFEFETSGTVSRIYMATGTPTKPPIGSATSIDLNTDRTFINGDPSLVRIFSTTDSEESAILFLDNPSAPFNPEAIIGYNHNTDTFNLELPNNGNIMNFTNNNGSEFNISVPNGNLTIQTSIETIILPTTTPSSVNGQFLIIDTTTSTPGNLQLEWSSEVTPSWQETSYVIGPITHRGYQISSEDPVLYLQALPTAPTDDSSVLITMTTDVGQILEIQYLRDVSLSEHSLSVSIPAFLDPNTIMKSFTTQQTNSYTWTYDEVLNMQIDRSGSDIYTWTYGPTGTPVMTISRDTGTNITTYNMDDLIDMSVNSGTGTYSWTFGPGGSPAMTMTTTSGTSAFTMDIDATGNGDPVVYSGGNIIRDTSLSKYKDNQRPLDFNTNTIYQLEPVSFDWNTNTKDFGYIAQQVSNIESVMAKFNGKNGELSGVKYSQLVVPIIEELKNINKQLDCIEENIFDLYKNKCLVNSQPQT